MILSLRGVRDSSVLLKDFVLSWYCLSLRMDALMSKGRPWSSLIYRYSFHGCESRPIFFRIPRTRYQRLRSMPLDDYFSRTEIQAAMSGKSIFVPESFIHVIYTWMSRESGFSFPLSVSLFFESAYHDSIRKERFVSNVEWCSWKRISVEKSLTWYPCFLWEFWDSISLLIRLVPNWVPGARLWVGG